MASAEQGNTEEPRVVKPLDRASDRIRESAKWLIVSFAAVGAVLAAGLQIAGIGELEGGRLAVALVGLAAAIVGIAFAIRAAGGVVTESFVSMKWLADQDKSHVAMRGVEGDTALLGGFDTVKALKDAYDAAVVERREALRSSYDEPGDQARKTRADVAQKWVRALDQSQVQVLERASFNKLSAAYQRAGRAIIAGAVFAAFGIAAFAWAANPPEGEAVAVLIPEATDVVVSIDEEDRADLQELLGEGCDLSKLEGVVVEALGESYRVASVASEDCAAALFMVSGEMGQVVPTSLLEPEAPGSGDTAR